MSEALQKTAAYFLIIIGTVIVSFFEYYQSDVIPYPYVWLVLGGILFILGVILFALPKVKKIRNANHAHTQFANELRQSGESISVDFAHCKILSAKSVKAAPEHDDYAVLIAGRSLNVASYLLDDGRPQGSTIEHSVFIFERERNGKIEKFVSPVITKDPVTLEFLLISQKQTRLYIDRLNRERYWFDLSFLEAH